MTLLIKNIQLLDGTGKTPVKTDVLIKKEKIAAIEENINYKADETIEGMGAYLSPGFIDINNHSDRHLDIFSDYPQEQFIIQGITTIIGGSDGISLAPLVYGSLQTIRDYADVNKINVDWHSFSEFFQRLKKQPLTVNFGTLLGHTTIRRAIIGEPIFRNLSENELKIFNLILNKNLQAGAFGISVGLNNPLVSQTSYFEIKKLAEIAASHKRLFAISPKNKKEGLFESIKKIVYLAKETGAKFLINDFLPFSGFEKDYRQAIALIEENSASADIHFSVYPFEENIALIETLLDNKNKISRLKDNNVVIIHAPEHEYLIGKSLEEFCSTRNLNFKQGLAKLAEIVGSRAEIVEMKAIDGQNLANALANEQSFICSSGSGTMNSVFNNYRAFAKFLEIAEKEKILPIEKAVAKITYLPAKKLGLAERGEIKIGNYADLVVFKEGNIKEVILNGEHVVKEGIFLGISAGKALKCG
ncbi:MAG: amidohydrolase family protein [Patescibacteria group bacterium]